MRHSFSSLVVAIQCLACTILLSWPCLVSASNGKWDFSNAYKPYSLAVCKGIQNSQECAQAIEKKQAALHRNLVVRDGVRLKLKLDDGEFHFVSDLANVLNSFKIRYFNYFDYLSDIRYYLLHAQHYEGGSFLLVSKKSGNQYVVDALPVVAPSKDYLATVIICDAYCIPRIRIWSVDPHKLALDCSLLVKEYWEEARIQWVGNNSIELVYKIKDSLFKTHITKKDSKWVVPTNLAEAVAVENCNSAQFPVPITPQHQVK